MNYMIESDRLILRQFQLDDAEAYFKMTRDRAIQKYIPYVVEDSIKDMRNIIKIYYTKCDFEQDFRLILEDKKTHSIVGAILADAIQKEPLILDVSILTDYKFRRKGFMFEALTAFISSLPKGTTLSFIVFQDNTASKATITKLPGIHEEPFKDGNRPWYRFLLTV